MVENLERLPKNLISSVEIEMMRDIENAHALTIEQITGKPNTKSGAGMQREACKDKTILEVLERR